MYFSDGRTGSTFAYTNYYGKKFLELKQILIWHSNILVTVSCQLICLNIKIYRINNATSLNCVTQCYM